MSAIWKYAAVAGIPTLLAITLAALLVARAQSADAIQDDLRLAPFTVATYRILVPG